MATTDLYSQLLNPATPEIMGLERQRQYARMLMQQSAQPQGQMVSGQFVAPSWAQQLNAALNPIVGAYLSRGADEEALKLAAKLRKTYNEEMQNYLDLSRGKEQVFEQAGPTPTGGNIPNQIYRTGGDIQAANLYGSTALNPVLQQFAAKKMLEGPQWKEISQFNPQTGNTENYRYDANSANPRETMQFLGVSKPAISPEAQIRFADEGIGIPQQFRGGAVSQPTAPAVSPYGANVQFTPNQPTIQNVMQPTGQTVAQPTGQATTTMPVSSGQPQAKTEVKASPVTLQRFGYNPFEGPPPPNDLFGKDLRAFKVEQKKPITGDAAKTVSGATNYMDALTRYKNYIDTLSPADLANPQVRIALDTKHKQVLLTGKEANNLGVLNGGDERILNAVMPNYSDILVTKNTLNKVIQDQREFGSGAIVSQYRTAEKAVPERLRQYVEIDMPKAEEKKGQPRPTGRVVRAMLGNEPIIVKDNKWVYERTGKPVQ